MSAPVREVRSVLTRTKVPVGDYCANPYVGCAHGCLYCYAAFMGRMSGHAGEPWGSFVEAKEWPPIKNPSKYRGRRVTIGTVCDPYQPAEGSARRTRALLEQLRGSGADVLVITKSDLFLRDVDLLLELRARVAVSVNTLDEGFREQMDNAPSIMRRLRALREYHDLGGRAVLFCSPVFPGITDARAICDEALPYVDAVWVEGLDLANDRRGPVLRWVRESRPDLAGLYDTIYSDASARREYWEGLDRDLRAYARGRGYAYSDEGDMDEWGIVNWFYHGRKK